MVKKQIGVKRVFLLLLPLFLFLGSFPASAREFSGSNSAKSAILIEVSTGQVLYAKNATERRAMASTTKIMTAMLTLEQPHLDEYFVVDPEAIKVEGSSMGLMEGDSVSLRVLAYGMLLPSGNDAANAAAKKIGGTEEAFVEMMNVRAQELGLNDTHFVTPSGLDAEEHYSTAKDMAMLAREALKNSAFREICSQPNAQVEFGNPPYQRWLKNSNKMLTSYEGAIGVKTGFTDEARRCLVSAAERNGIALICVTLNDPDDWQDTAALFDYGFSVVQSKVAEAQLDGISICVTGGVKETAQVMSYGSALVYAGADPLTQEIHIQPFYYAPVHAGDLVGTVDFLYNGEVIASQQLMCAETVERKITEIQLSPLQKVQGVFSGLWENIKRFFGR